MEEPKEPVRSIPSLLTLGITELKVDTDHHFWNYCVNCGTKMDSRKCKLFCPTCGFYHNCSEP